jgi:DNA-binding protein YbaB
MTDSPNGAHPVTENDTFGLADKSTRLQQAITEIEVEVMAEDGAVKVIAGAGGQVRKIDLGWHALQLSASELGPIVTKALRAAEQAVEAKMQSAVKDIIGQQFTSMSDQSKGDGE